MSKMTLAQLVTLSDVLATQYIALRTNLGDTTVEEPSDDSGVRGALGDMRATVAAFPGDDFDALLVANKTALNRASVQAVGANIFSPIMSALDDLAQDADLAGVNSLSGFLTYYNAGDGGTTLGTYNNGLMAPAFGRGVYFLTEGRNLEARNVYSPAIASLATKLVGGAFTHVADVDTTLYAGAARAMIAVSSLTGTGTAIVTGSARTLDGTIEAGRTFSAEIAGGSATLLVPQNAGDLLCVVSSISLDAGITAGTATVSVAVPASRTSLI